MAMDVLVLVRVKVTRWVLWGLWLWGPLSLLLWVWAGIQSNRIGWGRGLLQAGSLLVAMVGARAVFAVLYNLILSERYPIRAHVENGAMKIIPVRENQPGMLALAVPGGILASLVANGWGWTGDLARQWWMVSAAGVMAAWLGVIGTGFLYNRVVVLILGPVFLRQEGDGVRWNSPSVRRAVHLLGFLWIAGGSGLILLVAWVLLVVLAQRIPAGLFGVETGLFLWAVLVFCGYWVAWLAGLWCELGVRRLSGRDIVAMDSGGAS